MSTIKLNEILNFDDLFEMMLKCKRNVSWKPSVSSFYINSFREIEKLLSEIEQGKYIPKKPKVIVVTTPKKREVESQYFRDRLIRRIISDYILYPQIERSFTKRNYACQKGKGIDGCLIGFKKDLRKYYSLYGNKGYVLNIDFKKYFQNIRKDVCFDLLNKYVDNEVVDFMKKYDVLTFIENEIGIRGGGQAQQLMGIAIPNEIDHIIEEKYKVICYARYMDDLRIIHNDKNVLLDILEFIKEKMANFGINLHPKKTFISALPNGITFLQKRIILTSTGKIVILDNRKSVIRIKKHYRNMFRNCLTKKELTIEYIDKCFYQRIESMQKKAKKNCKRKHRYNSYYLSEELKNWYRKERERCLLKLKKTI